MRVRAPRPAGKCSSLLAARGAAGGKGVTCSKHGWEEAPATACHRLGRAAPGRVALPQQAVRPVSGEPETRKPVVREARAGKFSSRGFGIDKLDLKPTCAIYCQGHLGKPLSFGFVCPCC